MTDRPTSSNMQTCCGVGVSVLAARRARPSLRALLLDVPGVLSVLPSVLAHPRSMPPAKAKKKDAKGGGGGAAVASKKVVAGPGAAKKLKESQAETRDAMHEKHAGASANLHADLQESRRLYPRNIYPPKLHQNLPETSPEHGQRSPKPNTVPKPTQNQ